MGPGGGMFKLKMASLNLLRNGRRSFLSILVICVSVLGLMCLGGFGIYTYESLQEATARDTGHLTLAKPGYFSQEEDFTLQNGLTNFPELFEQLMSDSRVRAVQPRIDFSGLISNGDKTAIFVGTGVTATEFSLKGPFLSLKSGKYLSANEPSTEPEVMLGQDLANNLKMKVGDIVTVMTTTTDGSLNGADYRIRGIFGTGIPELDKRQLYVSVKTAQQLLNSSKVSYASVFLYDTADTAAVMADLAVQLTSLKLTPWWERAFFFEKVKALYDRIFIVIGLIMALVIFVSLFNTLTMSVTERTVEIGTLSALGASAMELIINFVLESLLLAISGTLLGILLCGLTSVWLTHAGIQMPPPPGRTNPYPLYINFSAQLAGLVFIGVACICVIASAMAARRGVNKPITEALNHV